MIYPQIVLGNFGGVNRADDLGKLYLAILGGGVNRTDNLGKLYLAILGGGGKLYRRFISQIAKYDLPQIAKYDLPPQITREELPLKLSSTIPPLQNRPILSKISNAHNIMLCFTKVFSAKDKTELNQLLLRKSPFKP